MNLLDETQARSSGNPVADMVIKCNEMYKKSQQSAPVKQTSLFHSESQLNYFIINITLLRLLLITYSLLTLSLLT